MDFLLQMFKTNRIFFLLGALLWTILIFVGCSLPGRDVPKVNVFEHFDKIVHFSFFLIFHFLWISFWGVSKKKQFILLILSGIYGFLLEFYQVGYVEGRSFDVWDGIADILGSLTCVGWIFYKKPKMQKNC